MFEDLRLVLSPKKTHSASCLPQRSVRFASVKVECRLLPLQILGKQAANTAYKAKACERVLELESQDGVAQIRIRSLMSDMGTESGLWSLPNFEDPTKKYFPFVLPLADMDHGLHHCMEETEFAYTPERWSIYFKQLNGLAKLFARRETVDRFVKFQILENTRIPLTAKQSLASMFSTTCPSLCPHRWMYEFEVLHWLCGREKIVQVSGIRHSQNKLTPTFLRMRAMHWNGWSRIKLLRRSFGVWRGWNCSFSHGASMFYDWVHRCPCHTKEEKQIVEVPLQMEWKTFDGNFSWTISGVAWWSKLNVTARLCDVGFNNTALRLMCANKSDPWLGVQRQLVGATFGCLSWDCCRVG